MHLFPAVGTCFGRELSLFELNSEIASDVINHGNGPEFKGRLKRAILCGSRVRFDKVAYVTDRLLTSAYIHS